MNSKTGLISIIVFSKKGLPELKKSVKRISELGSIEKTSSIYHVHGTDDSVDDHHDLRTRGSFVGLSLSLRMQTELSATKLVHALSEVQVSLTSEVNKQIVEINLVVFEGETSMTPDLTLPYPELSHRPEMVIPASEAWGDYFHPIYKESLQSLAKRISGGSWGEFFAHGKSALDF